MYPKADLKFRGFARVLENDSKLAQNKRYEGFGFEFGVEDDSSSRLHAKAYMLASHLIDAQNGVVLDAAQGKRAVGQQIVF